MSDTLDIAEMGDRTVRVRLASIFEQQKDTKLLAVMIAAFAITAIYFIGSKYSQMQEDMAAQKIVLQGAHSTMKSVVTLGKFGPDIALTDSAGHERVSFHVESDKARIVLENKEGVAHLLLSGGTAKRSLSLLNEEGASLASLDLANLGPDFGFYGAGAELHLKPFQEEGKTGFEMIDSSGKARIVLNMEDSRSVLSFLDNDGNENTKINVEENGVDLALFDVHHLARAHSVLKDDGLTVQFFDSLGRKRAEVAKSESQGELVFFDDAEIPRQAVLLAGTGTSLRLIDFDVPVSVAATEEKPIENVPEQAAAPAAAVVASPAP